jgi:pimeloyl-[acyl-carrier protein] methyl ester esterase
MSSRAKVMTAEVIAYHGWGFDSTCWQAWEQHFRATGLRFQTFDRGYFGHPVEVKFERSTKILLAHSYGLHLCPIAHLQQADLLIIFNSFSEFHPQPESLKRRSQAMLKTMLNQLEANPQLVLKNFRSKCYFPQPEEAIENKPYNLEKLIYDLNNLNKASITFDGLEQIPKIVLHGAKDRIVSPHQGKALLNLLGNNAQYIEIPDAGHALPFTHFQTCLSALNVTHAAYFS